MAGPRTVFIDYTNWRGKRREREIVPLALTFESNEWHPDAQYMIEAIDEESGEHRCFALANIHSWRAAKKT